MKSNCEINIIKRRGNGEFSAEKGREGAGQWRLEGLVQGGGGRGGDQQPVVHRHVHHGTVRGDGQTVHQSPIHGTNNHNSGQCRIRIWSDMRYFWSRIFKKKVIQNRQHEIKSTYLNI